MNHQHQHPYHYRSGPASSKQPHHFGPLEFMGPAEMNEKVGAEIRGTVGKTLSNLEGQTGRPYEIRGYCSCIELRSLPRTYSFVFATDRYCSVMYIRISDFICIQDGHLPCKIHRHFLQTIFVRQLGKMTYKPGATLVPCSHVFRFTTGLFPLPTPCLCRALLYGRLLSKLP